MKTHSDSRAERQQRLREANSCIAVGAGLGAWGAGTALLVGATCPLCLFAAPALIGVGVWKRFAAGRKEGAAPDAKPAADEAAWHPEVQRPTGR